MKTVTFVEAQNNFGRIMNTVPSEHVEFWTVATDSLSDETKDSLEKARKLPKSAFVEF